MQIGLYQVLPYGIRTDIHYEAILGCEKKEAISFSTPLATCLQIPELSAPAHSWHNSLREDFLLT